MMEEVAKLMALVVVYAVVIFYLTTWVLLWP